MSNYFVREEKQTIIQEYHGKHGDMARIARLLHRAPTSILRQVCSLKRQGLITVESEYKSDIPIRETGWDRKDARYHTPEHIRKYQREWYKKRKEKTE